VLAVALASGARAETPCSARVVIEPPRGYVGQQLVYRLRIERREQVSQVRFSDDLSFPSFRVEWLHGQAPDPGISGIGAHRIVAEERRALFPVRAGTLAIPASRIACTTPDGVFETQVPGAEVEVDALPAPEPGRVVGRVALVARLERDQIALGESVALHVQLHGEANVWDAAPALAPDAIPGVEILAREPHLDRESGRRLLLTRTQTFDLVPRAAGRVELPRLHVDWLDPASGRWERTESTPLVLVVTEAATDAAAQRPAQQRPAADAPRHTIAWGRLAGVAFGAAAGAWLARAVLRKRRHALAAAFAAEAHLEEAEAAHARGDRATAARALAAALRAAIDARMPGAHALAAEELVARSDGALRAAAEALADLDRSRFATAAAPLPDASRIRSLIAKL
jgi:hypothetical protein